MYITVKLSHKDAITDVDVTSRYCHSSYHYQTNQSLTLKVSLCQIKSCHKSLNQSKLLNIPSDLKSNTNLLNHSSSHSTNSPLNCEWSSPACRWSSSWFPICWGFQCQRSWRFFNNSSWLCLLLCLCHALVSLQITWRYTCILLPPLKILTWLFKLSYSSDKVHHLQHITWIDLKM